MLSGFEEATLPADAIEVGRILDAWGIKGWFKVAPYSASPEALFSCNRWFLLPAEKGVKTFQGCVVLRIKQAKSHADTLVACTHEITDRATADALRGARIFIPKSNFPATQADEYYWIDLIGLEVINREAQSLGWVSDILTTGPQAVLVIDDISRHEPVQRMIPFVAHYIDDVHLQEKKIQVDWQLDY